MHTLQRHGAQCANSKKGANTKIVASGGPTHLCRVREVSGKRPVSPSTSPATPFICAVAARPQARNYVTRKEQERKRRELFDDALDTFKAGDISVSDTAIGRETIRVVGFCQLHTTWKETRACVVPHTCNEHSSRSERQSC